MIQSKQDLKRYIRADFDAQGMEHPLAARFTYGENYAMFKYMKTLRKLEYYKIPPTPVGREVILCMVFA